MNPTTQLKIIIVGGSAGLFTLFLAIYQRKKLQDQPRNRRSGWLDRLLRWLFPAAGNFKSNGEYGSITSMRLNLTTEPETSARSCSPPNSTFHDSSAISSPMIASSTPKPFEERSTVVVPDTSKLNDSSLSVTTSESSVASASSVSSAFSVASSSSVASSPSNSRPSSQPSTPSAISPSSSRSSLMDSLGTIEYIPGAWCDSRKGSDDVSTDSDILEHHETCDCQAVRDLPEIEDTEALFEEGLLPDIRPTFVLPVQFSPYRPLNLVDMDEEDMKQDLSPAAITLAKKTQPKTNMLTPFRAILHCIVYASKHAYLIEELVENFSYLETQ